MLCVARAGRVARDDDRTPYGTLKFYTTPIGYWHVVVGMGQVELFGMDFALD
jgi:hypothetical protein